MTYWSSSKEQGAERFCKLQKKERKGKDEIADVVWVDELPQLSLSFLGEIECLAEVSHAEVWHDANDVRSLGGFCK
jgi:hypothetical protein